MCLVMCPIAQLGCVLAPYQFTSEILQVPIEFWPNSYFTVCNKNSNNIADSCLSWSTVVESLISRCDSWVKTQCM